MIHRILPQADHLRAYIYQGLQEGYFSEFYDHYEYDLEVENLYESEIEQLLDDYFPDYLYYFSNGKDALNLEQLAYSEYPPLYTNFLSFCDHEGGLFQMERFMEQNYSLVSNSGVVLESGCHDMYLGINGIVQYRPHMASIGWFFLKKVINGELVEIDRRVDSYTFFPYTLDMHPLEPNFIPLPNLSASTEEEFLNLLEREPEAWRVLYNWYDNDKQLALKAIQKDCRAFGLCSETLRANKDFCDELIFEYGLVDIMNYLPFEFTSEIDYLIAYYRKHEHLYFSLTEDQRAHPIIQEIRMNYEAQARPLGAGLADILGLSNPNTDDDLPF